MFFADLHIHSRYSRGTSKALTLPVLSHWAKVKGIHLLGTGDCTHRLWLNELKKSLIFDEPSSLYKHQQDDSIHYYILQGEISSIYKKNGRTYKVHNLVFLPTFEAAESLSKKLEKIGNIEADGRPILKLDSKDLLDMILNIPNAYLVPAHVWTPWFSLFGAKSGFDSVEECFEELTPHIFAMETGLSSDVKMNRQCKQLNQYSFISNSDAHSGPNLAREVNIFEGKMTYEGLFDALHYNTKNDSESKFIGTLEFFPQMGKYYASGHRACNVVFDAEESEKNKGICPVCHKALTHGVSERVTQFAQFTSTEEHAVFPQKEIYVIPLVELLSVVHKCGEKSQKIQKLYTETLKLGTELDILCNTELEKIQDIPLRLVIQAMRNEKVNIDCGYDGIYGKVHFS